MSWTLCFHIISVTNGRIEFDDISLLSNGNFVWSVTAENCADDGFLIQSGNPASNEFSIQVQLPGKIQIKDVGAQYGE